jgi:hypothetical protein
MGEPVGPDRPPHHPPRLRQHAVAVGHPQGRGRRRSVSVVLGCNHIAYAEDGGDCQPLHDNIVNYGGDRWIPLKNPIGDYNNYF